MVMHNLQQIMLRILEHHKDALVLQDDFDETDDIDMAQLGAQGHLTDGRLRDTSILDLLTLLVRLELLDGELADLTMAADGFVDPAVGPTADEADDLVLVYHTDFTLVGDVSRASIRRICDRVSKDTNELE